MDPSFTSVIGFSPFFKLLSSVKISAIRSAEVLEIVIITNTIESIIRLIKICMVYVNKLINSPVLSPMAALPPLATTALAPNQEIKIIQPYTQNCINGIFNANVCSAFVKSL